MKSVICLCLCLLMLAGCEGPYYYDPDTVSDAIRLEYEAQQPTQVIPPQQQQSTYWQETRARQEYYESLQPGLWDPK